MPDVIEGKGFAFDLAGMVVGLVEKKDGSGEQKGQKTGDHALHHPDSCGMSNRVGERMESLHEKSFGCQVTAIGASASLESAVQPSAIGSQDPAAESRTAGTRTPDYRARHPPPETKSPSTLP